MGNKKLAAKRAAAAKARKEKAAAALIVDTSLEEDILPVASVTPTPTHETPPAAVVTPSHNEQSQSPSEIKSNLFDAIQYVFQNKRLQKKWLDGNAIVDAINMLCSMPKCTFAKGIYEGKYIQPALQLGLGSKYCVGDNTLDFDIGNPCRCK